jgi:hypothetical protein
MIVRTSSALLFLLLTGACTQSAGITVLSASGVYDANAPGASVLFRSDRTLTAFRDDVRPVEGILSICGQGDRYSSSGAVTATADPAIYSVVFPPMADRVDFEPDGRVSGGWPADKVRSEGICFRLQAAEMLWSTLTTDEVVLPR